MVDSSNLPDEGGVFPRTQNMEGEFLDAVDIAAMAFSFRPIIFHQSFHIQNASASLRK